MKRFLPVIICAALCVLSSCVTTGPATQPTPASAVQWQYTSGLKTFGLSLVSTPKSPITGPVEIVFSTTQDIELSGQLIDLSANALVADAVDAKLIGGQWHVGIAFPKTGRYSLALFGRMKAAAGNNMKAIAQATLSAKVSTPSHWTLLPGAAFYGLTIVDASQHQVQNIAEVSYSTSEETSFAYNFTTADGTDVGDMLDAVKNGTSWKISVAFPKDGDYLLTLWGKPVKDESGDYQSLAKVSFAVRGSLASVAPAGWTLAPGFWKYGAKVVSAPSGAAGQWVDVLFELRDADDVTADLFSAAKDAGSSSINGAVDVARDGDAWKATVFFPKSGDYKLGIYAKSKQEASYSTVAWVALTSAFTPPTSPANWEIAPRFWKYGLSVLSSSPRDVGEEAALELSLPEDFQVSTWAQETTSKSTLYSVASAPTRGGQRIALLFPKSGTYTLTISGHAKAEKYSQTLATVTFQATTDDTAASYRMWPLNASWPKLPVSGVTELTPNWTPLESYWVMDTHKTGTLTEDLSVTIKEVTLKIAKGTRIEFGDSDRVVEAMSYVPSKDVSLKIGDSTCTFKAGSPIAFDELSIAGIMAKDTTFSLDGNPLACAKGSRVIFTESKPSEITLEGTGTFTHASKRYQCTESVIVQTEYAGDASYDVVRLTTTKPYPVTIGDVSFTLPEGSLISFKKDAIEYVGFMKDFEITINGEKKTIPASYGLGLDEKGALKQFQLE